MNLENERAARIMILINEHHDSLTIIYESLVDREHEACKKETVKLIMELKELMKSIDNDF
jgi:hypothetical protein